MKTPNDSNGDSLDRRRFLKGIGICSVIAGGAVLGSPPSYGQEEKAKAEEKGDAEEKAKSEAKDKRQPSDVQTNIDDFMKVPKGKFAIPGPFPGRVVEAENLQAVKADGYDAQIVRAMVEAGIRRLTGLDLKESFRRFFDPKDVVGIKINPVGPVINTRLEVTEAVIRWLVDAGLPKENIIIWDRFEPMLKPAGYTPDAFPGIALEGLQTMDEEGGDTWRKEDGTHVSEDRFDKDAYYFAKGIEGKGVRGYQDDVFYLNQHVFNGEYSYFGKLITKRITKLVNLAAYKNTGNGISMATKNLGYAAICNTGRLHQPLFFTVCTEVLAAPWIRDKLVLNITDGLKGQYDGGPGFNDQFVYNLGKLYFATDPFALDMVCHKELVQKRKDAGVTVNEHPMYTDYLHYAERLGLGIANLDKIEHVKAEA